MSDKLAEIIATKHLEVAALLPRADLLRAGALLRNDFGGFRAALDRGPGRRGVSTSRCGASVLRHGRHGG